MKDYVPFSSSENHSYNVNVAVCLKHTGKATILKEMFRSFQYWKRQNMGEHEGDYWFFIKMNNLGELYPEYNPKSMYRWIKELESLNLIASRDDLNRHGYDRTRWFTVNEKAYNLLTEGNDSPLYNQDKGWLKGNSQNEKCNSQNEKCNSQNETTIHPLLDPLLDPLKEKSLKEKTETTNRDETNNSPLKEKDLTKRKKVALKKEKVEEEKVGFKKLPLPIKTQRVREAWEDFVDSRYQIKKPLTPTAAKRIINRMKGFVKLDAQLAEQFIFESLDTAITNQYQGVFFKGDEKKFQNQINQKRFKATQGTENSIQGFRLAKDTYERSDALKSLSEKFRA